MVTGDTPTSKVYRLRGIPNHLDRLGVTELLGTSAFLPNGNPLDINIASLAPSCDIWSRTPSKTATLTFSKLPCVVQSAPHQKEWQLSLPGLERPMVLDDSFYGVTPLNDVPQDRHEYDCIVISGLASHPMGSWQPRGSNKSFMWIRDALPRVTSGIRFQLYGYDTALVGSKSFQTIPDLAVSLINALMAGDWTPSDGKPLLFLAHSLGGVVLKQMFVMLARSGVREIAILEKCKGAIFFGVPSQGMPVSDLLAMLGTQPNGTALVADISDRSQFLPQLERQLSGLSIVRSMKLFWAYETQTTPTVVENNGRYERTGPERVLVVRNSATGGHDKSDPASTIQIDANHSDMVKLMPGHHIISLVAYKLRAITCFTRDNTLDHVELKQIEDEDEPARTASVAEFVSGAIERFPDLDYWNTQAIVQSLHPPERDNRLAQIDERAGRSFEWVFDRPSIGLVPWLHNGRGIFWISGRPGSGKSTMMKFLHNDPRTRDAMKKWQGSAQQICASFFFHHRGTAVQKSFHGLLSSILSQIMESEPRAISLVLPYFQKRYQTLLQTENLGSLQEDVIDFIIKNNITVSNTAMKDVRSVLGCESPRTQFREIVERPLFPIEPDELFWGQVREKMISNIPTLRTSQGVRSACHELSNKKWSNKTKSQFNQAMLNWRKAVNLNCQLHNLARHSKPPVGKTDNVEHGEQNMKLRSRIEKMVKRQERRDHRRAAIEMEKWTLPRLSLAFTSITDQKEFDLDLCLFLDALDEYDGRPEFISEFLRDLIKGQGDSRTHIRIIFSSRPWDVFLQDFGNCPGFQIHEHTENDMRELCASSIQGDSPGLKDFIQLVPEIVQRARGVFLWVKLVLVDLTALTLECSRAGEHGKPLRDKLLAALKSLPNDLADYYKAIIERIPLSFRLETYILLEALCRSSHVMKLQEVPLILSYSTASKFFQHWPRSKGMRSRETWVIESKLRTASGGLIEVVDEHGTLQLLHQTVVEFIEQPRFKHIVLGRQSQIVEENGHSFLAKYFLCCENGKVTFDFLQHAFLSERTTGVSLYGFLSGSGYLVFDVPPTTMFSPLEIAIAGSLQIFIRDALEDDSTAIAKSSQRVVTARLLWPFENGLCGILDIISMAHFIQSHGWDLSNDPTGVSRVLFSRHKRLTQADADLFVIALLGGVKNVDFNLLVSGELGLAFETKCLHVSSLKLAQYLLSRGADPNSLDSNGNAPLDSLLEYHEFKTYKPSKDEIQQLIRLLLDHGGRFLNMTQSNNMLLKRACDRLEIDVEELRWMITTKSPPSHHPPTRLPLPADSTPPHDPNVDSDELDEAGGASLDRDDDS